MVWLVEMCGCRSWRGLVVRRCAWLTHYKVDTAYQRLDSMACQSQLPAHQACVPSKGQHGRRIAWWIQFVATWHLAGLLLTSRKSLEPPVSLQRVGHSDWPRHVALLRKVPTQQCVTQRVRVCVSASSYLTGSHNQFGFNH